MKADLFEIICQYFFLNCRLAVRQVMFLKANPYFMQKKRKEKYLVDTIN